MSKRKIQYLAGWGLVLNDTFPCKHYLNTHGVPESIAMQLCAATKLTFDEDILQAVEDIEYGQSAGERPLHFSERGFPYKDIPLYLYYNLFADNQGIHQLGGKPPVNFKMPEAILDKPFLYLGFIKNDNAAFSWIGTDVIHLVCPIFLSFNSLYMSLSDPLSPQLVSCGINFQRDNHNPVSEDSFIEYQPVRFSAGTNLEELYGTGEDLGNAGIPEWIQDSEIPGSGNETMRFLCQLRSKKEIKAINHNIQLDNYPYDSENFTSLNFWGDGDLFVFYDPLNKLISYRIQNS